MAKAFILVGDIYLKRGDAFQAKNTWQSLIDGYAQDDDDIKQLAREKITALDEQEPDKQPVDNE